MKSPKTITICCSANFFKESIEVGEQLKKLGFKVLLPKTANLMKKNKDFDITHYKTWFKDKNDYFLPQENPIPITIGRGMN